MTPDKQNIGRIKEILSQAKGITDSKAREEFLKQACGDDTDLRKEVESLLEAYDTTSDFLSHDASGEALLDFPDLVGTMIDNYRLVEHIGEGGFGEVYRAEQTEPLRREVALKVIKLGMDTKNVIARFEVERQALARMNHPGIAQVYDAGTTESGRPYFVMELVDGIPIIDYCDQHRLSMPDRIGIFRQVCDAVQHAHDKGILHRDLKPSNILVGEENGKPMPKIIDFGVAKSLEGRLTEETLATLQEMLIGTPMYMSPEQLSKDISDIDTRSDIYSLGVVLYELLAGTTPLEHKTPTSLTMAGMRKALTGEELPRPSKRVRSMGKKTTIIAHERQIKPPALERLLRGDLDWVIMKAIEKERDRRYDNVEALAQDLEHYLNHKPVSAGPPSVAYRTKKFVRRHRMAAVVIASIGLTTLIGVCIMTFSYSQLPKVISMPAITQGSFYSSKFDTEAFGLRPDGSALIFGESESMKRGLYHMKKAESWSQPHAFSFGPEYTNPTDIIDLPDGIYITVNGPRSRVLKVPPEGGKPEILCDDQTIINPISIQVAPSTFRGPNVNPGDLLVFDNAHDDHRKTAIWVVNRTNGSVKPLIMGSLPNDSFTSGSFGPDGMLYALLSNHKTGGMFIYRISPGGDTKNLYGYLYYDDVENLVRGDIAVHPVTGRIYFCHRDKNQAFLPGERNSSHFFTRLKYIAAMEWTSDGSKLIFLQNKRLWVHSDPKLPTRPVSIGQHNVEPPVHTAKEQPMSKPPTVQDVSKAKYMMSHAAIEGDIATAEALLEIHPILLNNINTLEGNESTPLHVAAHNGRTDFVRCLLINKADVTAVNKLGMTPLHVAASQGHLDIVEILLAMEAPMDVKDNTGKTPLEYARDIGHDDVAELLSLPLRPTAGVHVQEPQ